MPLRLATWNCRRAVDRKRPMFDRLGADVIVVPECSQAPKFSREQDVSFAWRGTNPSMGIGVFGLNGWTLRAVEEPAPLPWLLPLRLVTPHGGDDALLLAIWTVPTDEVPSYTEQVTAAIAAWTTELRDGPAILAGDTNCSMQTTDAASHLANIDRLGELGAASCYHRHHGVAHGEEEDMTLSWVGRGGVRSGFHCDFIIASADLLPRLRGATVGSFAEWVGPEASDHAPVICDFA